MKLLEKTLYNIILPGPTVSAGTQHHVSSLKLCLGAMKANCVFMGMLALMKGEPAHKCRLHTVSRGPASLMQ